LTGASMGGIAMRLLRSRARVQVDGDTQVEGQVERAVEIFSRFEGCGPSRKTSLSDRSSEAARVAARRLTLSPPAHAARPPACVRSCEHVSCGSPDARRSDKEGGAPSRPVYSSSAQP